MASAKRRMAIPPVGIDLGTTYSCLATLTPRGQAVTVPNTEGELSTPSVVLFDGDEAVVGTEALRHSVANPERVVLHAKRFMGDPQKCWVFDQRVYRPRDIAALILRKLIQSAEERLGSIRHAVITVPAQFSELQRQDTVEAGLQAGLERVDIINEPTSAAMCHVLGEGMWFAELANDQTVLVFDLGGGTFDLSLVKYNRREVRVLASGGDLRLGGLDWNRCLQEFVCDEFIKESISDPRLDRESMQGLAIEVEQVKRSLSVRPRSTLIVQHDGRRKSYMVDREHFEILTRPLLDRTEKQTIQMLKDHGLGWANVDAVLVTGGASRMPMVRNMLQRISGTTLNQTLSPDQSICHGAAYYAGSLLEGRKVQSAGLERQAAARLARFRQQGVSGRSLGILIRDMQTGERSPHYLIPANTPLPCAYRQRFGTVVPNQTRVHLRIVESGTWAAEPCVEIGECIIDGLPADLPAASPVEVTIRYDEQARVHVEAVDVSSGSRAQTTIVRPAPAAPPTAEKPPQQDSQSGKRDNFTLEPGSPDPAAQTPPIATGPTTTRPGRSSAPPPPRATPVSLENADRPIPLCNRCGNVLDYKGRCPACKTRAPAVGTKGSRPRPGAPRPGDSTEVMDLPLPPRPDPVTRIRKNP